MAKATIATKVFVGADGEEKRSAFPDAVLARWKFTNGELRDIHAEDVPEDISICAKWHGLGQKFTDEYATIKSVTDAIEKFDDLYSRVILDGKWVSERGEGGPRTTDIATAVFNVKQRDGTLAPDETIETIAARYRADDVARDRAQAYPPVKAEIAKIRADRAAAKAAELAAMVTEMDAAEVVSTATL